jgi:type 2 lantibiotic biosynthesis protein LanM
MLEAALKELLLSVIARGSAPQERLSACFEPVPWQDPATAEQRVRAWRVSAGLEDNAAFGRVLEIAGWDPDVFLRGFRDVRVLDEDRLPDWARTLLEMFHHIAANEPAPDPYRYGGEGVALQLALTPFLRIGEQLLRLRVADAGISVTDEAGMNMLAILARRLSVTCLSILESESAHATAAARLLGSSALSAGPAFTAEAWLNRLNCYPSLGRALAVTYANWRDHISELLERLSKDLRLLGEVFFSRVPNPHVTRFWGDTGDIHENGRAVALIEFSGGQRIVYKPKDLRVASAFMSLVDRLNRAGLSPPLHVRNILCRDGYAWDEYIEHRPCQDIEGVRRFYHRIGSTTRLLQLLGARDFWLDNLIAHGDQPVFVDYEMVVQQPKEITARLMPSELQAIGRLEESAAHIGIIAFCTPVGNGLKAEDMGALTPVRPMSSPFKLAEQTAKAVNLELTESGRVRWGKDDYAPVFDGRPVAAASYLDQVIGGYRAMQDFLAVNRDALAGAESPLRSFATLPVRHIHRDTWSSMSVGKASMQAAVLVDGVDREIYLAGLYRTVEWGNGHDRQAYRVVRSEIDSFRNMDIPLFRTLPGSSALLCPNGPPVDSYFGETAARCIARRIDELDQFDLDEQIDIIRTVFSSGPHQRPGIVPSNGARNVSSGPDSWLRVALEIGDFIRKQAVRSSAGDLAWIGLVYHPHIGCNSLEALPPNILSGTCGLACLFADFFVVTRDHAWRDLALDTLRSTLRVIQDAPYLFRLLEDQAFSVERDLFAGAFHGIGSQLYALGRCARAIEAPELSAAARDYANTLPLEGLCKYSSSDVIAGTSGLMLALLTLDERECRAAAIRLARILLRSREDGFRQPRFPAGIDFLDGLPGWNAGIAMSFLRLLEVAGPEMDNELRAAAESSVGAHARALAAEPESPGNLLAMLLLAREADDRARAASRVCQLASQGTDTLTSLQIAQHGDLYLTAHQRTGNACLRRAGEQMAETLLVRHADTDCWFPDQFAADRHNLSAITGIGAIAHILLRLCAPGQVTSLRCLE